VILLQRECSQGTKPPVQGGDTTTIIHRIEGDSIPQPIYVDPIPAPVLIEMPPDPSFVLFKNSPIDTMQILRDYLSTRFYDDTLTDDSTIIVYEKLAIRENRIVDREVQFMNLRPIAITNNYITPTRNRWYFGAGVGGGSDMFILTWNVGVVTKRKTLLMYRYDVVNNAHEVTYMVPVDFRSFKKHKIP
jgi:hypothetical protein